MALLSKLRRAKRAAEVKKRKNENELLNLTMTTRLLSPSFCWKEPMIDTRII